MGEYPLSAVRRVMRAARAGSGEQSTTTHDHGGSAPGRGTFPALGVMARSGAWGRGGPGAAASARTRTLARLGAWMCAATSAHAGVLALEGRSAGAPTPTGRLARVGALARASHPLPTVAVTAFAVAVARAAGRGRGGSALVGAAVLAGQLSVGWCNDAVDARRDRAAGRGDKPAAVGELAPRTVGISAGAGLAACAGLSWCAAGGAGAAAHLTGVLAGGWAYDLGLKGTVWSPLPYAVGFGSLPAFVTLGVPGGSWPPWWAPTGAALLGMGAHLLNVLPDLAADRAAGVVGLPHRLGARRVRVIAPAVLLAAVAVLAYGPPGPVTGTDALLGAAAATTAALGAAVPGDESAVPFRAAIGVAALAVALLIRNADALTGARR